MDFILYPLTGTKAKKKIWMFSGISPNTSAQTIPSLASATEFTNVFDEIFPVNYINYQNYLMPLQGWTVVQGGIFTTYAYAPSGAVVQQDQKSYTFPRFVLDYDNECGGETPDVISNPTARMANANATTAGSGSIHYHYESDIQHAFISGDFNGDGLTDMIAVEKSFTYPFTSGCSTSERTYYGGQTFFVNLDKRLTSNYVNDAGNLYLSSSGKIFVADFNGDGKSDVYVFDNGSLSVFTLNTDNHFALLTQSLYDSSINTSRPILIGDYNGDGKSDFMIPIESGNGWYRYTSTGSAFNKEFKNIAYLTPNDPYNSYNYFASDYDNDGKSDLTVVQNSRNSSAGTGTIKITAISETAPGSYNVVSNTSSAQSNIDIYALPIYLPSTDRQRPHFEIAFINNNKLHFFNSPQDSNKDRLVTTITYGNGVQQFISYQPLDPIYEYSYNSIYNSSLTTEKYPYFDIVSSPDFQIVTSLEKKSGSVSKIKRYGYYGAVTNMEGLGFQGFRSIMETNWHNSNNPITCTITNRNINLRGAETDSYFLTYLAYPYRNFVPSSYTTKSNSTYTPTTGDLAVQANKVFKLQNTGSTVENTLENSSVETANTFDSYNNITYSQTIIKEGSTVIQTNTSNLTYETPVTSPRYILGRLSSKNVSSTVPGSPTMTSNEAYRYDSYQLLSDIDRSAAGTSTVTEHHDNDASGNIMKISLITPLSTRNTWFEYDPSGRFLAKKTDNDALITSYEYYDTGMLKKETSPYAQTSYTYDSWLKLLTTTDDKLNKTVASSYTKSYSAQNGSETTVTTTTDVLDGSVTEEKFDDLGRLTRSGKKDVNGTFSYTSFLYDIYDRNYKISEPYFGASPSQWNETKYDVYGRPTDNISFNGRTSTALYEGLSTTYTDGAKSKKLTKNAIGNIISSYQPSGGTILYSYFANGNLRQTNYNGVDIVMEQDGWGRKSRLEDPSAGIFNYKSNDFDEITEEKSQNGNVITTITRDPSGRPINKKINGGGSNSETSYTYDSSKLPLTISYQDNNEPAGSNKTTTTITYNDTFKRPTEIKEEKIGISKFTRTFEYDGLGRISAEIKTAEVGGKISTVRTTNEYKNGSLYKIYDANNNVLWQVNTLNPKGQILESIFGNGIKMTNEYDSDGYLKKIQHDKTTTPTSNIITLTNQFNKNTDYLDGRTNSAFGNYTEAFGYDDLGRLKTFTNKLGMVETQNYDPSGKITSNNLGTYEYDPSKPYRNTAIALTNEATGYYSSREGIFNDTMEDKNGWGPSAYPSSTFYTYDNSRAHTGATSLKLTNTSSNKQYVHGDKWIAIDNSQPTEYTYSAWVYSEGPQAEIFLFMKTPTETQYFTDISNQVTNVTNQWYKIEKTVLVQPNIKKLNIRLDNNGYGNMWYDDVQIRKTSNAPTSERQLITTYNGFKSPIQIEETGVDKLSFLYNDDNQRSMMYYGGLQAEKNDRQFRKYYSSDGSMEVKQNTFTGNIEFVTYINGDGYTSPIAVKSDGVNPVTSANFLYLHRDYQGSILAITDSNGSIVEKRLFDAWGSVIKVQDGAGNILNGLTVLDRGYTGHEHLQSVGLINMNARLYDPVIHRFLQVDNYIQDPTSTQNYNQYGYAMNNPLLFIDPSGNSVKGNGNGNDCVDCGWGALIGSGIATIVANWDNWGIKDWANRNINGDKFSKWWKGKINTHNLFGRDSKNSTPPPPPNISSYIYINSNNYSAAEASYLKHNFDIEIENAYPTNADKIAVATDKTLTNMRDKIPTLKNWSNKSGKPVMYAEPNYRYAPSDGISEAKTFAYDTDNYKISTITFFNSSFDSYRKLAYNMLHEYGHSYFNYTGQLAPLVGKYGTYSKKPQAYSEVYAFEFAYKYGGVPYKNNAWYQTNKILKDSKD
ncbi:RHS repeat-associated core domain-containing protein [Flavobacterium sp. KACC 22761]|uniref:RHS repeat-associated core domain-containing protein n=1 Tax=Flavobacterium sp. KACC 22761 TaxID=3092665 RepID=UPI002A75A524|nr:RHS repeat-associated core domain-containing protein [Flavobacterium sp. KACC 22761]WPO76868.1 FG-GAP-like repeat-containing protein [Flavobacterium sp. KACC 22761]